ncbi:MAG: hypothetical protein K2H67_02845 [Treponemataceae bacterium]|nr:hypothetical protein [Treponemataceae bacterium]
MDRKNDSRWFNEILRIEKEQPFAQRKPDDERDLSFSNALTETQIDDYFAYNGEKYPCRNIFFHDENASYLIATERLEKALLPDGETYASEEARAIDEQILCFVPEAMFGQPEEAIEQYISEAL